MSHITIYTTVEAYPSSFNIRLSIASSSPPLTLQVLCFCDGPEKKHQNRGHCNDTNPSNALLRVNHYK